MDLGILKSAQEFHFHLKQGFSPRYSIFNLFYVSTQVKTIFCNFIRIQKRFCLKSDTGELIKIVGTPAYCTYARSNAIIQETIYALIDVKVI
jgi:hypothetical protein